MRDRFYVEVAYEVSGENQKMGCSIDVADLIMLRSP